MIVATPTATPVIVPPSDTVAIVSSLETNVADASSSAAPTSILITEVPFSSISSLERVTFQTVGFFNSNTVTVTVLVIGLFPSSPLSSVSKVIVTVPIATPVTYPEPSTIAIVSSLEVQ